jgi:hypothetical protein
LKSGLSFEEWRKTMEHTTRIRVRLSDTWTVAALLAIALAAGCDSSDTVTGAGAPPPTGNVAGTWTGMYAPDDFFDCASGPAQATFQQEGSIVTGILSSTSVCGFPNVSFQGTIRGNILEGTITGDSRFAERSLASGQLSGSNLYLELTNTVYAYSGGSMQLHR